MRARILMSVVALGIGYFVHKELMRYQLGSQDVPSVLEAQAELDRATVILSDQQRPRAKYVPKKARSSSLQGNPYLDAGPQAEH